jgi:hypothetical protein
MAVIVAYGSPARGHSPVRDSSVRPSNAAAGERDSCRREDTGDQVSRRFDAATGGVERGAGLIEQCTLRPAGGQVVE